MRRGPGRREPSVEALRRRIEELERWFQRQDLQIRFLERERQKLSALVNHTDAGFLVFDAKLTAVWLNNVCRGWFHGIPGADAGRALGCNELLCRAASPCADCPTAGALRSAGVRHREIRIEVEGSLRDIYATAMPIRTPENRVDECILMLQDITDLEVLRRSQDALVRAKEAAESANRSKGEFLANMSHEVRTPMTGVLSMASVLLDTPLSSEQRECVGIIQSSGEALMGIIDDILDFSRIEAGRLSIEPAPFDLLVLVEDLVTLVAAKAEEKGVALVLRYAPGVPRRLVGDAGRIRQVLLNLVGNAVKFTHRGRVVVRVEPAPETSGLAGIRLSVKDSGIGIEADKLASVFEKFTQADGSITRLYGGTGLGLAIAKQLVELMGGAITVASTPGMGSTFSFRLALPRDVTPLPPMGDLENLRVLVQHPDTVVRDALVEQIVGWKAAGHAVATGGEALAALRAARAAAAAFHVAILGGEPGDEMAAVVAGAIRSDRSLESTTVVLWASLARQGDMERIRAAGFDAYLTRPARPTQLHVVLVTARDTHAARSRTSRAHPSAAS